MEDQKNYMKPEDIEPGKSYACKFKAEMMLDDFGRPPGLSDTPLAGPGMYESFGLIKVRDSETKLFRIEDLKGEAKGKIYTVPWDQCWDIDVAELVE
jgi:hypothetical protein|tara:strand:+ start:586 stop:876 length:291 start_codon:yes stop_codon:yes gene_type:complete